MRIGGLILRDIVKISGVWRFLWHGDVECTERTEKNIIVQTGLDALAGIFTGEIPQDNAIYLALGKSTVAATKSDIALKQEEFRKIITDKTRFANELRFRFYLMRNEANALWREAGVFLSGTEQLNSGYLLNRILPGAGINKASNQSLTVEIRIPLT